ncbi:hypothetical protein GCM10018963_42050 [Saccharothrix longispora]
MVLSWGEARSRPPGGTVARGPRRRPTCRSRFPGPGRTGEPGTAGEPACPREPVYRSTVASRRIPSAIPSGAFVVNDSRIVDRSGVVA